MSFKFLAVLDDVRHIFDRNSSEPRQQCTDPIDRQAFNGFMLLPAMICTGILAFTKRRTNLKKDFLRGRPGLVFPQDIMSRKNRLSFAAAFGALANICIEVIYARRYAFDYTGPLSLKAFVALISMLIYGLDYFPLFASLAVNNIPGYVIGTLYAWTLMIITFYRHFNCDSLSSEEVGILIARGLPLFVCHIYLCISIPVRLIRYIRERNKRKTKDIDDLVLYSYAGIHVRKILRQPLPPPPDPTTTKERLQAIIKALLKRFVYNPENNFRYSGRILCIMTVAFMLLYQSIVEELAIFENLFKRIDTLLASQTSIDKNLMVLRRNLLRAFKGSTRTSTSLAFVINVLILLHTLTTFKNNLLKLYKGNPGHLIPMNQRSNPKLLVRSMQYAGFQVAYIGWGFAIQGLVLWMICFVFAIIIVFLETELGQWILDALNYMWPVLLTSIAVKILQYVLAKYVFLERRGAVLSITNRRLFFIVVYFMFFYNIFLGLFSCLLRILKAIVTGILYLPRLDHSILSRQFEWFDPGFNAYCGFMHVECAQTHPVAITFIRMLQAEAFGESWKLGACKTYNKYVQMESNGSQETNIRRHRLVIFKWKLVYTLLRNPELIIQRRKGDIPKRLERNKTERLKEESVVEIQLNEQEIV